MSFFYFLIINFDWYKYFPLLGLAFVTFGNLEVAKRVRKDHTRLCCGHANPPTSTLHNVLRPDNWEVGGPLGNFFSSSPYQITAPLHSYDWYFNLKF